MASLTFLVGLMLAQPGQSQDKTVSDGVFTAAQVASGQTVYDSQCKTCHNMRFYRDTLRSWNNQPLLYLWENIMGTMPADNPGSLMFEEYICNHVGIFFNPGSLMFEEYTDVIAYILSENGFPPGDATLDPDNGMDAIKILAP